MDDTDTSTGGGSVSVVPSATAVIAATVSTAVAAIVTNAVVSVVENMAEDMLFKCMLQVPVGVVLGKLTWEALKFVGSSSCDYFRENFMRSGNAELEKLSKELSEEKLLEILARVQRYQTQLCDLEKEKTVTDRQQKKFEFIAGSYQKWYWPALERAATEFPATGEVTYEIFIKACLAMKAASSSSSSGGSERNFYDNESCGKDDFAQLYSLLRPDPLAAMFGFDGFLLAALALNVRCENEAQLGSDPSSLKLTINFLNKLLRGLKPDRYIGYKSRENTRDSFSLSNRDRRWVLRLSEPRCYCGDQSLGRYRKRQKTNKNVSEQGEQQREVTARAIEKHVFGLTLVLQVNMAAAGKRESDEDPKSHEGLENQIERFLANATTPDEVYRLLVEANGQCQLMPDLQKFAHAQ